jgi:hypothetical protein
VERHYQQDALDNMRAAGLYNSRQISLLLTPGAAEALAVKVYRLVRTTNGTPIEALQSCLIDYQNPVPLETLEFQIRLAVTEASDLEFVPSSFRVQQSRIFEHQHSR